METVTKELKGAAIAQTIKPADLALFKLPEVQERVAAAGLHLSGLDVPTTRHEEWKYAQPKYFAGLEASQFINDSPASSEAFEQHVLVKNGDVFCNQTAIAEIGNHLTVKSFKELDQVELEIMAHHFGTLAKSDGDFFASLNTVTSQDGLFIRLKAGKQVEKQLVIKHQNSAAFSATRIFIFVEAGAHLSIAHEFSGSTISGNVLVSETFIAKDAFCHQDILQNDADCQQVALWYSTQDDQSVSNHVTVTLDGQFVRNNLTLLIPGKHAEGNMYGLYLVADKDLVDNHTLVDHIAPNSQSNELYKGVAKDRGTAVFNGKIFVKQAAQKTNAFQSNRNLMLSDDASINTKPQLEIFADDVKCSHGATTGALDEEPIFYLRARGLSEDQAKAMLLQAFADEVIGYMKNEKLIEKANIKLQDFLGL